MPIVVIAYLLLLCINNNFSFFYWLFQIDEEGKVLAALLKTVFFTYVCTYNVFDLRLLFCVISVIFHVKLQCTKQLHIVNG